MATDTVIINSDGIRFSLTVPRSRVRIADKNGNHIAKPVEAKFNTEDYIEWMITNDQVKNISDEYLNDSDKREVKKRLTAINNFLKESQYARRIATEGEQIKEELFGFRISKYTETFYSFLKLLPSNVYIRHTFKQGDFTLADNMYVLLPFNNPNVKVFGKENNQIVYGSQFGSGAYAIWKPTEEDIKNIIESLSYASKNHRDDLIEIIEAQF